MVWLAWALAWVHQCSGGDPLSTGSPEPACGGLVGLRLDRYGADACGAPDTQVRRFVERLAEVVRDHNAVNPPSALLGVASTPFSAATWVRSDGSRKVHVESAASTLAHLHPLACSYLAQLKAWRQAGQPTQRAICEAPFRVVPWQAHRRSGQVVVAPWRVVVLEALLVPVSKRATLPAVVFRFGSATKQPPKPQMVVGVASAVLEEEGLTPGLAARLASVLGVDVPTGASLESILEAVQRSQHTVAA